MADLWFAVAAKRQGIPLVAIEHPADWVRPIPIEGTSLYEEFQDTDDFQTDVAKKEEPWALDALAVQFDATLQPMVRWLLEESTDNVSPVLASLDE